MPWLMALRVVSLPATHEQHEEQVELEVGQRVAVDLGGEQVATRCRRRGAARFGGHVLGEHVHAPWPRRPGRARVRPVLGVVEADEARSTGRR